MENWVTTIWLPLLKKHLTLWGLQNIPLCTTPKPKDWQAWHSRLNSPPGVVFFHLWIWKQDLYNLKRFQMTYKETL